MSEQQQPGTASAQRTTHSEEECPRSMTETQAGPQIQHEELHLLQTGGRKFYPRPVVKHEEVVANRDLFYDTLSKFHLAMGTRFVVPTIGGKDLDLHLLYVEVTARGGLEQVIKDRKWKEITGVFNFPRTTTSASFVLRKYYMSLLHHYEQAYFFQAQASLHVLNSLPQSIDNGFAHLGSDDVKPELKKRKRRSLSTPLVADDPASLVDCPVTGVIDGKFEQGYLVTVTAGTEKLKGILYHMPSGGTGAQFADVSCFQSSSKYNAAASGVPIRRRKKKNGMRKRDPDHPKPNRSGYNFFFAEQHTKLKELHPDKDREISKMIGESWSKLSEEEKAVYQGYGLKDKERYKREMQVYKERLKSESLSVDALKQLDKHPNSSECRPDYHSPLEAGTKLGESKMAQVLTQSCTAQVNMSAEQKPSIQENNYMKPMTEQGAYG